jgi:hypothetical protein
MKRFITAMLFSLTIIVCEQQTLFAPHYTTYGGTSLVAGDTTNSLIPIVGVNRLIPVAGTNSKGSAKTRGIWQDCNNYDSVTPGAGSGHGDMPLSYNGDAPFEVSAGDGDTNVVVFVIDDLPFLERVGKGCPLNSCQGVNPN